MNAEFSQELLQKEAAKNPEALTRIRLAKRRIQSVLDRETVSHPKTLEQKIAEQGPKGQHVDPHLIGHAIFDLLHLNRLREHSHPATGSKPWYANPGTNDAAVNTKLDVLAPLYASVSGGGFGNRTGDALEIIVFKCLDKICLDHPRFSYQGYFYLDEPKNQHGRYKKTLPSSDSLITMVC